MMHDGGQGGTGGGGEGRRPVLCWSSLGGGCTSRTNFIRKTSINESRNCSAPLSVLTNREKPAATFTTSLIA